MIQQIENMKQLKVIISGGGSGGHIFPALAIAKSLEQKVPNVELLFVGAINKMEMEKIPNAGYNIKGLWISGIQRRLTYLNLIFPFKLIHSLISSIIIINRFKPDLVIGTGGFASGPLLYIAAKNNLPTIIQEQNSYAGITNKLLSKYVKKVCVAYHKMDKFFPKDKIVFTGNPIRESIVNYQAIKDISIKMLNLNSNQSTVLVIGGSLGARTINVSILNGLDVFKSNNLNLIWQTGKEFSDKASFAVKKIKTKGITTYSFIKEIDLAYKAADIIISRAGAIAISELCSIGKPVILIPSPNVAENHQFKNAQSLVNKNAALLVNDADSNDKLVETIISLYKDDDLKEKLSINIKKMEVKNSASIISKQALDLLKK
jgi:UDP-N-acetylglucosamine--N-acetylmuramyl-(pentapeptide) pyrophosphoryl-undecaprenol N-acetylglucosamine transferase